MNDARLQPILASAALALWLASAGVAAAGPVSPGPPSEVASTPTLFDRVFDRREYERQTRELARQREAAALAAERAREAAAAQRQASVPPLRPQPIAPLPTIRMEDREQERRRAERDAFNARQRAQQQRLQALLAAGSQTGAAHLQAEIAAARAAQTRRIVSGLDRLYGNAASARNELGEPVRGLSRPLTRIPRVVLPD